MNLFNQIWYQKHPLFYLLAPLSGLYKTALFLKKWVYQFKLKKITRLPVPIIIVGNLTVGGTGKTPLIIALANFLTEHGYKPGIVSRGYGGKPATLPLPVYAHTSPLQAGDEPVLIARKTHCPVIVDPNRVRAAKTLLTHYHCDLILSDDGLQHTALGRDIEIVVIDGERRFGNGWCLPAGPLREPVKRLSQVDFIVTRGKALPGEYAMQLALGTAYCLTTKEPISPLPTQQVIHAVAGIGNPARFFQQLRDMGLNIIEHPFPDHYNYTAQDLEFGPNTTVVMTEKDAVKCEAFANKRHWCLPVVVDCGSMLPQLLQRLKLEQQNRKQDCSISS